MRPLLLAAAFLAMLCYAQGALADCRTRSADASFGSMSSFTLNSARQVVQTGSGFICTGGVLTLVSSNTVTGTIVSSRNATANQPQLFNAVTQSSIPYVICEDRACSRTYSIGSAMTWRANSLVGILGMFNASDGTLPLYLRTTPGVNVPAGTYTDTLTINWAYRICAVGAFGVCIYDTGQATSTINITLNVSNDCSIDSAPDLDFGTAALPRDFNTVSSSLNIRCTRNAAYRISLSSSNPLASNWRQMSATRDGRESLLQYQLYKPGGSVWGENNDISTEGTGAVQVIPYSARINPQQQSQPAGRYSETITVMLSY